MTAQRQQENAQGVPIAITAITATDSELRPTRRYSVSASVANITDRKFLTYAPALRNPADAGLGLDCSVSRGSLERLVSPRASRFELSQHIVAARSTNQSSVDQFRF